MGKPAQVFSRDHLKKKVDPKNIDGVKVETMEE